jgi:predicted secreted protein
MNLSCKIALILLLISAPVICRSQVTENSTIKLSRDDSGKKLAISKGQRFTLTLPDHVDGGYRFNKPQYNKAALLLIKHDEVSPGNNNRPGEPGHDTWEFIAVKKGASSLKITASRPWAKNNIIIIYSGMVLVK